MNLKDHIRLGSKKITQNSKPYIIAEIGVNHENSLSRAKKLINLAKKGGADAVKLQTYKAEKLASKHSPAYWDLKQVPIKSQYKLFKKFDHFNKEDYVKLSKYCKKINIDFLSSGFDIESVDIINPLVPFHKIASADITNFPLLKYIAKKGKPVLISKGASTIKELMNAIQLLKSNNCRKISILHCILNYPTKYDHSNLEMISYLKKKFPKYFIGYSDHTFPDSNMLVLTSAYMKGAKIIEKHFTDNKKLKNNDHFHSMDFNDLKKLVENINFIDKLLGKKFDNFLKSENISRKNARRSVYTSRKIYKGEILNEKNIIPKRPGNGISPIHWDKIIGKKALKNLKEDALIKWKDIK